jgi:hypothetical protein
LISMLRWFVRLHRKFASTNEKLGSNNKAIAPRALRSACASQIVNYYQEQTVRSCVVAKPWI